MAKKSRARMSLWMPTISMLVGGFGLWQIRTFTLLYEKTTGSRIGRTVRNRALWIAVTSLCGMTLGAALSTSPLAIALWAVCTAIALAFCHDCFDFTPVLNAESHRHIQSRLEFLRSQLQRLEERSQLDTVLTRVSHSESALGKITDRFELILGTIENHLLMGDHGQAERIITVFARHLRQTLYEGSMPFLPLSETVEHIQTHFDLMHMLTGMRFSCDVDDGMLDELTLERHTATFVISDWAQRTLWPYFQLAERSLEPIGDSVLSMDLFGNELVVTFAPPESMYLPEGASEQSVTQRFNLLGDPSAAPSHMVHRIADALAS